MIYSSDKLLTSCYQMTPIAASTIVLMQKLTITKLPLPVFELKPNFVKFINDILSFNAINID